MTKIEKQLREYADSVFSDPDCKTSANGWVFGAIDFALSSGQINMLLYDSLLRDYGLLE